MTINKKNTSYLYVPIVAWFIETQGFSEFFRQAIYIELDILRSMPRMIVFYAAEESAEATPLLGCSMIVPSHQILKICETIYDNEHLQKPFICMFQTSKGVEVVYYDPNSLNKLSQIQVPVELPEII